MKLFCSKITLPVSFILITLLPLLGFCQQKLPSAEQLLKDAITDKKFMGVVAGISLNGQIEWMSENGYSDLDNQVKINHEMLLRTASMAKPMTAVAVMQLWEKGLIDLDQPIQQYLPDFPIKKEGSITVRHLLTHTSGIKGYKSAKETESKINYPTLADAINVFKERDLAGTPGKVYHYTSYGYVVLGRIIEQVSGLDFETYMRKNIWEKAGMMNTGVEKYGVDYPKLTRFFHRNKKGKIIQTQANNLSNRIPGGGFYSTVEDMLRFGNAVLNHTLIKESSLQMMMENPGVRKEGNPYGFGWFLYGDHPKYGPVIGHSGGQRGASTQLMLMPDQDIVIIVMANTSGAWEDVVKLSIKLFDIAASIE